MEITLSPHEASVLLAFTEPHQALWLEAITQESDPRTLEELYETERGWLGFLGELSPQLLINWGARMPIAAMELSVNTLQRMVR